MFKKSGLNQFLSVEAKKRVLTLFVFLFIVIPFSSIIYAAQEEIVLDESTHDESTHEKQPLETLPIIQKNTAERKKLPHFSQSLFPNVSNSAKKKDTSTNSDALSVSLGLLAILVMIFSLAWLMKKMGYSNLSGQGQLKIISTLNLGHKEKIALIQVGEKQLLVGMTATQINTLHVLDEPILDSLADTESAAGVEIKDDTFAHKLTAFLNKK